MEQEYFKKYARYDLTSEEFAEVQQMADLTDLNYFDFCMDYRRHGQSKILNQIFAQYNDLKDNVYRQAVNLLHIAQTAENPEIICQIACNLTNWSFVVKHRIDRGLRFTEKEAQRYKTWIDFYQKEKEKQTRRINNQNIRETEQ